MALLTKSIEARDDFWEEFALKEVGFVQDLLVYCKDGVVATSQVLLAAASNQLYALLKMRHSMEESGVQSIILPDVSISEMKQILSLSHTGVALIGYQNIPAVLTVAQLLGLKMKEISHEFSGFKSDNSFLVKKEPMDVGPDYLINKVETSNKVAPGITFNLDQLSAASKIDDYSDWTKIDDFKKDDAEQELNFSDDGFYNDELNETYSPQPARVQGPKMTHEGMVEALKELSNSSLHLDKKNIICGVCEKMVTVPAERKIWGKYKFFRKQHYSKCLKNITGETLPPLKTYPKKEAFDPSDDEDCLESVYARHEQMRNLDSDTPGRKKNNIPDLQVIRGFLQALGGAVLVQNGTKVKCGICKKNFKVIPNRPIMGSIRYFEKSHLVRCSGVVKRDDENKELVTDVFGAKKKSGRRKTATPYWDEQRAQKIVELVDPNYYLKGKFKKVGRPKKGFKANEEEDNMSKELYLSKRKQALFAVLVCPHCDTKFSSSQELEEHFRNFHNDLVGVLPYKCLACCEWFAEYHEIMEHLDGEHNYKSTYPCDLCEGNTFETQSKLNKHLSEVHPEVEVAFPCRMCTKSYPAFPALKAHMKTHTERLEPYEQKECLTIAGINKAFICRFCNVEIMYGKHLESHIRTHHIAELSTGIKPFRCHVCSEVGQGEEFETFYNLEIHLLKVHSMSMENICRFCKKASNNRSRFLQHFKEHHANEMPYECPRWGCDRQFSKYNRVKDHLLMHRLKEGDITEDMKKLCMECGKVFYFRKKLEEHMKFVHQGAKRTVKIFHCHLCVKTYNSNAQLQAHIRKHEGSATFMCDLCGKGFYRKDRLQIHNKTIHLGIKKFSCSVCQKKFVDNYKLKRHMRTHDSSNRGLGELPCTESVSFKRKPLKKQSLLHPFPIGPREILPVPMDEVSSPLDYSIEETNTIEENNENLIPIQRRIIPPYPMSLMNQFMYPQQTDCNTNNQ